FSPSSHPPLSSLFFFTHPPPPALSTLSLHDALPISLQGGRRVSGAETLLVSSRYFKASRLDLKGRFQAGDAEPSFHIISCLEGRDRKSTRLNSSHRTISYAVFCLKKKKTNKSSTIYE